MSYTKKIICLANSRKHKRFCFAGKEVLDKGYGRWIRPVSAEESGAISEKEQTFSKGGQPQILDVVTIPMLEHKPVHHQRENHLIDSSQKWEKTGSVDIWQLPKLLDSVDGDIWVNGRSDKNDRVLFDEAEYLGGSLLLIKPENLKFIVRDERSKSKVRADFNYNGRHYFLVVTDPDTENKYQEKSVLNDKKGLDLPREYPIAVDDVYLCLSLGEKCHNDFDDKDYCYKLVATVIGDDD